VKEDLPFLFWGFTVIWGLAAGYIGLLFARQAKVRRQIDELRRDLDEDRSGPV
jgi:hypothetical protein